MQSWSSVQWFLEVTNAAFHFVGAALRGRPTCAHLGRARRAALQDTDWIFHLDSLGWDADFDVLGLDVAGGDGARADQRVVADGRAGQNSRVVSDADAVSDSRLRRLNVVNVVDVMVVRIDVRVI